MNVDKGLGAICRLCGKEEKYLIDIFSNDGRKQKLEKKIRLCLPITVTVDDELPRQVCLDCLNKLDAAFDLYMGCIEAQHYIREKLGCGRRQTSVNNCNGAVQPGFSTTDNSNPGRNTAVENSLRSVLGLQRTFSSYVGVEQKRLAEVNMQRMVGSSKSIVQEPGIGLIHNSPQYVNSMGQVNASSSNGHLVGTQLDGTSLVLSAPNISMMQATDSQVAGNLQGQMFVSPHMNSMNPAVSVASAPMPVMAPPQSTLRSAQLTVPCNQPCYPTENNLPSSLQMMPVVQVGSSDRTPTHYAPASSIYHAQSSSMSPQNGVQLSQAQDQNSQFRPPTRNNIPYIRRLLDNQATTMVTSDPTKTASNLFNHIPTPSVTMPVASSINNAGQMHTPAAMQQPQPQQQHMDLMQQTVSLWMNNAAKTGSSAVSLQPIITQVTSGYQNGVTVQPSQEASAHMDLSNDTDDDDMAGDTGQDGSDLNDDENVKPFALSTPTLQQMMQKKSHRRKNRNASTKEMCPHCQKEFSSDIIFHHVKLHFRQSFFSCLDCGRNYSSEKALEAHKCPGEEQ